VKYIAWIWVLLSVQSLFSQTLTLHTAIEKTLSHHPDVKTFMLRIQQAEQGSNVSYADYLPQLDFSTTYNPSKTYVLPVNGMFHTIEDKGWDVGVTLHQKVWDFAKTSSIVDASKVDENIAKLSLGEVKALLAYKVKSLYALLVVQREAIHVRKKDLEAKQAFYAQSKALVKQGFKTNADAHRFLSEVYAAKDNLAIAKAAFQKAKTSLSLYMGRAISSKVKLQSSVLKKNYKWHKRMSQDVVENNYKIKIDKQNIHKNKLLHKSTKSAHFGSVDLVASYNRFDTLNQYNSDYVGVSYNVPLYSGGRLSALEQKAHIGTMIAQEEEASDRLALQDEFRALQIDIKRYGQTIKAKQAQLSAAKSTLRELRARYKEGLATYIEVLDSISLVLNAKLGVLEAYYSRSLALDRIVYLKGKIE
jgi:outer membrane protein TolC